MMTLSLLIFACEFNNANSFNMTVLIFSWWEITISLIFLVVLIDNSSLE